MSAEGAGPGRPPARPSDHPAPRPAPSPLRRSVLVGLYAPTLVFAVGVGAVVPIIALRAVALGADVATAGLMVALLGVGQIAGDVPAGTLAARVGDRRAMLVASALAVLAFAGCALAPGLWMLAAGVLAAGAASSVFGLARQAYLTEVVPVLARARALSTLGGVQRIGAFVGPFLGAGVVHGAGLPAVFWLAAVTSALAGVVVAVVPDAAGAESARRRGAAPVPLHRVARDHARVFATLGIAVLAVGAVRAGRQVVLPLWTEHLGLSPATTSLVFGISGAVDMLLFYPAGHVMDRRGRLWVAIPSMLVLGASILALPWTTTLAGVTAVAMVMGLGNGIGSGILMTLGADVAPPAVRSQFLGVWRLLADSGGAAGPLLVSAGAALGSLAAGISAMGVVGLLAAAALGRWVPRWSEHANATTRRAAAAARVDAGPDADAGPRARPGADAGSSRAERLSADGGAGAPRSSP
ncbi:MFS transporter [uncultured Cellulomonas sp.]|uniref:MFS transporter n=1 Tax=uncultured Cellulomonas sp. TaxID=189682 RepID=UPI00260958DB|nr:MFS transporter [uncultured Cellulomonas sp.]